MYRQVLKFTFALMLIISLSGAYQAQAQSAIPGHLQTKHSSLNDQSAHSNSNKHFLTFSPTDGEPVLLLLFGLALFLGATTIKRKTSDLQ